MSVDDRTGMDDPFMHSNHILRAPMFTRDFSPELKSMQTSALLQCKFLKNPCENHAVSYMCIG